MSLLKTPFTLVRMKKDVPELLPAQSEKELHELIMKTPRFTKFRVIFNDDGILTNQDCINEDLLDRRVAILRARLKTCPAVLRDLFEHQIEGIRRIQAKYN